MKKWYAVITPSGTQILDRGEWKRQHPVFFGKSGVQYGGFSTKRQAEVWIAAQVSPLELELRERLDPLPDGPIIKGQPLKETFHDVWVKCVSGRPVFR